jgi:[acyl-carrier-protein] S-malonyltransferase
MTNSDSRAFVFPGQGSQSVGMAVELAQVFAGARQILEEVDDALDQNLSRLMRDGPEDELTLTENAQPAIMAASLAVARVIEDESGKKLSAMAKLVAGHSLGEYSALAATGALTVVDTARLLKTRGRAMQEAVPVGLGAMAALLGLDVEAAEEVARDAQTATEVCVTANDNAPGQVVVSGHRAAVERAAELAKERGAKRAMMLPVSAPFHCPLMAPAAEVMKDALAQVAIAPPSLPVMANVTASLVSDPETVRRLLVEQVTGRVRWRESVLAMSAAGILLMVELGAGRVLSTMVKRIDPALTALSVHTPADIEAFLKTL